MRQTDLLARLLMPLDASLRQALPWLYALDPQTLKLALFVLTLPVVVWAGRVFYLGAWRGFQHRSADMNTLIGVGTASAMLYSAAARPSFQESSCTSRSRTRRSRSTGSPSATGAASAKPADATAGSTSRASKKPGTYVTRTASAA
jgi:hypothetical protein